MTNKVIKGLPLSNISINYGDTYSNLMVDVVIRRQKPVANNLATLRDSIVNPNSIYCGRTTKEGIYNVLGLYQASYINEEEDNQFVRLKTQYLTSVGEVVQLDIDTPAESHGNAVTLQITVNQEQLDLLNSEANKLKAEALNVTIRIPHVVLQGVYLSPNGVPTVTPVLPADPNAIEIVNIERYSAQFGYTPNVVPADMSKERVQKLIQNYSKFNADNRNSIAAGRQALRLEQSVLSSSQLTAPNAVVMTLNKAIQERGYVVASPSSAYIGTEAVYSSLGSELPVEYNAEEGLAQSAAEMPISETLIEGVEESVTESPM